MPKRVNIFEISQIGGINSNDQANALTQRSHRAVEGGFVQVIPTESPDLSNVDFSSDGLTKRKGSTEEDDFSGVLVTDDEVIAGVEFINPSSNARIEVAIGKKSIYTDQSGSWAQINNSNGSPYTHSADITKCTLTQVDGHLFIGLDGANAIQVYKGGADLDNQYHNSITTTTVDADSASGQKVLNVDDTTPFQIGDNILVSANGTTGGARYEEGVIDTIQAGTSITLEDNLSNTHTAAQSDVVKTYNRYENVYDSSTNVITGDIGTGYFLVSTVHSRLIYSDGNVLVYYSPTSQGSSTGVYDIGGGTAGSYQASGRVRCLANFSPYQTNTLDEVLYIGTNIGWEIPQGFTSSDNIIKIESARSVLNHQSWCITKNWLVYLTQDKNIFAINGTQVIDLGRRAKSTDGTGALDAIDLVTSEDTAFGFFNGDQQQAMFFFSTDTDRFNDRCIVIDLKIAEPVLGQPKDQYEPGVRLLRWDIKEGATNDWYAFLYKKQRYIVGLLKTGITYEILNGQDDFGTLAVESYYYSPVFMANTEFISKQFLDMFFRGKNQGGYLVYVDLYINRDEESTKQWSFLQGDENAVYGTAVYGTGSYSSSTTIKGNQDVDLYVESLQWKISNSGSGENFLITTQGLRYLIGAEER